MTTDLAVRPPEEAAVSGLEAAERVFTPERREAIARYVRIDPDDPGFIPFLAVAAHYGLNPLTGEIWLIRTRGKALDGKTWEDQLKPATGRDGYLKVARQEPRYRGFHADVVRENDRFVLRRKVDVTSGEESMTLEHEYPELADRPEETAATEWRGKPVGAYAIVYVDGNKPTYYWAPFREHAKFDDEGYKGAWSYVSSMLIKSAVSYAHRLAVGITGLVPADEIREGDPPPTPEAAANAAEDALTDADPEVAARIRDSISRINELEPGAYPEAKAQMQLAGQTPDRLEEIALELEAQAADLDRRRIDAEEIWERSAEPADAEVVPEEADLDALRDEEAQLVARLESAEEGLDRDSVEAALAEVREKIAEAS